MNAAMLYPRNTASRQAQRLDGMWNFSFDPDAVGRGEGWPEGLPQSIPMPVPSSFQDLFTDKESRDYGGDVWYETEIFVPAEWQGKEVDVRFGSATHRATVYCNGRQVAFHEGGFTPFCARITGVANYGAANRLVVCVSNELHEYTVPAGKVLGEGRGKRALGYFDFFNYSGLQRPVWLVCTPKAAIEDFSVVHSLVPGGAEVAYTVQASGGEVELLVLDEAGAQVAAAKGAEGVVSLPGARLWDVLDAYLYRFVVRLYQDGALVDEWHEDIGIRTVEIRGTDICVNGKPVYLKGFGKHEDSDVAGRGFNLPVMKRDFELMKWTGANSFRTSHYPYCEEVYQLADREGFLVIDEVAAVGFMASFANFLGQGAAHQLGFFEKETTPQLLENHLQAVRELIARDKNHACVIAWSLFNEPETNRDSALPYFEKIFAEALRLDPQKRPRTFAMERSSDFGTCRCHHLCDFISLNRYYGWYISGGSDIARAEAAFREEMDGWKASGIDRPVIFAEYGADTDGHMHKLPSVMWSQEYQTEMLTMNHRVFDAYAFVKGEQVWNFADFQTGEGTFRVDGNKKGVFTRQRQPKDSAFLLKKRWESLPREYKAEK